MKRLTALAAAGVILALLIARSDRRRLLTAVSGLAVTMLLLVWALGAAHVSLTLVSLLVFPFVLGIGIDASVYLLEHAEFRTNRQALIGQHLRPLLGSTLTTLLGFVSLVLVPFAPIRELGLAVSIGLGLALIVALLWVPLFAGDASPSD
jgi:predicted RND superfamily exporter protein